MSLSERNFKLESREYSYAELAHFFQISLAAFLAHTQEKIEELKGYADFSVLEEKIKIKEVYFPYYLEKMNFRREFKRVLNICFNGIRANEKILAKAIKKENSVFFKEITYKKILYLTKYFIKELYGNSQEEGLKGKIKYKYFLYENNTLIPLSAEQEKEKNRLIFQWYGNLTEQLLILKDKLDNAEIDKIECWDYIENHLGLNTYAAFKKELENKLSYDIINGFEVYDREEYETEEDDNEIDDDEYSEQIYRGNSL